MKAIDVHAHVTSIFGYRRIAGEEIANALESYYGVTDVIKTEEEVVSDFKSKEELFQAVIRFEREMLINRIQKKIDKNSSAQRKLHIYLVTRMNGIKELINLYKLARESSQEVLPLIQEERRLFFKAEKKLVLDIMKEGIQKNVFHVSDPEFAAITIIASMRGLESTIRLYEDRQFSNADYDSMLNILCYGILKP